MSEKEVLVFEVSINNFESVVLQNSNKLPVLVEFMGVWSGPCIKMADEITDLAQKFSGQFLLAKVDIDEQIELKQQYGIENVPCLKVFQNGELKQTEEGLLNSDELKGLLKTYGVYSRSDELRLQARELHMAGDTPQAIQLLVQAIKQDPSNVQIAMDMGQIFIDLNELDQAKGLYNQLPDSEKNSDMGKQLLGQLTFLDLASKTQGVSALRQQLFLDTDSCELRFDLAICLVAEKNFAEAVDYLFEIHSLNPEYKQGAAKEMIVNVANMLAPNQPELASSFRRRLGSEV
ncbi:MAG: tetratricopeptide repeat protein [Gammaproteobacteria bacterium]|nr:tetratricopeptide repeat protein [Gammaproteobacteria bacterium]